MEWVLLVTWIVPGQPPSSSQTSFTSEQSCTVARDQVLASALTMRQQKLQEAGNNPALQMAATVSFPHVSAVCSRK